MLRELFYRNFAVESMVYFNLLHAQQHHDDFRIDSHIFRQKDTAPLQFRLSLFLYRDNVFPFHSLTEFFHHICRKQRLGNKAVHTGRDGFFRNIVPAVSRQDDDGGFIAHDPANLP